jgi:tetratricopeptide (TPR) repeat protein
MAQRVQPVRTDLIARALTRLEVELAVLEGRPERAEAAIRRLLARQQEELGPRHPFVGQSLSLFARLADAQERFEPGATLWTEARAIFRNAWGERHPDVAWTTLGLANNRTLAGQPEEAERLAREATAIAAALAREAPADQRSEAEANHGRMLSLRAEIDLRAERFEDARDGLERALPLLRDRLGPGHPETAWARVLLGETLSRLGGFDRAEAHLSGGMEAIRRAHGDRHPVYGGALMHRAAAYASAGWFAEATADFEEARLIRERILEREEKV